jgi:hypothetical protein
MNVLVFNALLLVACGYAAWGGGGPERWCAGSLVLAAAATRLSDVLSTPDYVAVPLDIAAVDLLLLAALTTIALRANRYWPLCLTSLHLSTILVHGARLLDPLMTPGMYQLVLRAFAYATVIVIAVGTLRHRRRLGRLGADSAWA